MLTLDLAKARARFGARARSRARARSLGIGVWNPDILHCSRGLQHGNLTLGPHLSALFFGPANEPGGKGLFGRRNTYVRVPAKHAWGHRKGEGLCREACGFVQTLVEGCAC